MDREPTVLFCVGAAKAGTSWLYRYLDGHPDCHMRSIKELHYFDGLDHGNRDWQVRQLENDLATIQERPMGQGAKARQGRIDDHRDLITLHRGSNENTDAYLAFLNKGRTNQPLIADITPAYGLLSEDRLAKMAGIAENVRFLYVIRDPVDRLWSHIRMLAARRVNNAARLQEISERIFWRSVRGRFQTIWERSDYRQALEKLDRVAGPGQLFTAFFEELFSQKTMRQICGFLGIGNSVAMAKKRVNQGPQAVMDANMLAHAREWLAPQYEYVLDRTGYLPANWQRNAPGSKLLGVGT